MAFDAGKVRDAADRVARSSGLEVVEIEFHGSAGKSRMLRIFIEKNDAGREKMDREAGKTPAAVPQAWLSGVTHEDCESFSRELGTLLDVEELVPGSAYTLEVSSPGLDRKLAKASDYERFTGSRVKLMTREPIEGNRHWQGRLARFEQGRLKLEVEAGKKQKGKQAAAGREIEIDLDNVEKANLVPEI